MNRVNEAFIHTRMLIQAIPVTVYSSSPQVSHSIFTPFTASFGIDCEVNFSIDRPHLSLTFAESRSTHPLQDKSDEDWLGKSYVFSDIHISSWQLIRINFVPGAENEATELYMQRVLDQIPPTYPILHTEDRFTESPELKKLMKPETWNHIVHIRCNQGAKLVSEECFHAINHMKNTWQFQFYFAFDSDDVRRSSLEPWFASLFAHATYSRIRTGIAHEHTQEFGDN